MNDTTLGTVNDTYFVALLNNTGGIINLFQYKYNDPAFSGFNIQPNTGFGHRVSTVSNDLDGNGHLDYILGIGEYSPNGCILIVFTDINICIKNNPCQINENCTYLGDNQYTCTCVTNCPSTIDISTTIPNTDTLWANTTDVDSIETTTSSSSSSSTSSSTSISTTDSSSETSSTDSPCGDNPLADTIVGTFYCNTTTGKWIYEGNVNIKNNNKTIINATYELGNFAATESNLTINNSTLDFDSLLIVQSSLSFSGTINVKENFTLTGSNLFLDFGSDIVVDGCVNFNNSNLTIHITPSQLKEGKNTLFKYKCNDNSQFENVVVDVNEKCKNVTIQTYYEENQLVGFISLANVRSPECSVAIHRFVLIVLYLALCIILV